MDWLVLNSNLPIVVVSDLKAPAVWAPYYSCGSLHFEFAFDWSLKAPNQLISWILDSDQQSGLRKSLACLAAEVYFEVVASFTAENFCTRRNQCRHCLKEGASRYLKTLIFKLIIIFETLLSLPFSKYFSTFDCFLPDLLNLDKNNHGSKAPIFYIPVEFETFKSSVWEASH